MRRATRYNEDGLGLEVISIILILLAEIASDIDSSN